MTGLSPHHHLTDRNATLASRVEYAVSHIEQYERDILGRVPVDLPSLKRLLRDVATALRERQAQG